MNAALPGLHTLSLISFVVPPPPPMLRPWRSTQLPLSKAAHDSAPTRVQHHAHSDGMATRTHSLPFRAVSSDSSGTSQQCLRMTGCTCLATLSSSSLTCSRDLQIKELQKNSPKLPVRQHRACVLASWASPWMSWQILPAPCILALLSFAQGTYPQHTTQGPASVAVLSPDR